MPSFNLDALEQRRMFALPKVGVTGGGSVGTAVLPAFATQIGINNKIDPVPTFQDDFNGTSIDLTKWQVRESTRHRPTPTYPTLAVTDRSSVVVKNGELQLIAYTDAATGQYRSGWIQTDSNGGVANDPKMMAGSTAHFEQRGGYWEAKMKFSSINGMWSAFWVHAAQVASVGNDASKVNHPEIYGTEMDVVENGATFQYQANQNNQVHSTVHANGYGDYHISSSGGSTLNNDPNGYHTYGLFWDTTSVSVFVDGYMMYRETNPNLVSKVEQMAILSNEIGVTGSTVLGEGRQFWGLPPAGGYGSLETSQAKMTVDYIRVWKLGDGTSSITPIVASTTVQTRVRTSVPAIGGGGGSTPTPVYVPGNGGTGGGTGGDGGDQGSGGTGGTGTGTSIVKILLMPSKTRLGDLTVGGGTGVL